MSMEVDGPGALRSVVTPSRRRTPVRPGPGFDASLDRLLDTPDTDAPAAPEALAPTRPVVLSRHAESRLASRGIDFGPQLRSELQAAVETLDNRGASKALVLTGEQAWIVGVPKRTVITVMSREEALGQVFTDLDATYLAP